MSAARVVESVDVFEEGNCDLPAGLPVSAPDHFRLEGFEKALDRCVVIAVPFAAHRRCQAVFAQDFLVVVRTVLAATIRVMDASLGWLAQGDGHVQGTDRQVLLHPVADRPPDHPAGMQVEDDGQIDPAFARPDIGDVARPFLVGLARSEILLQQIRRDVERVVAVGLASGNLIHWIKF